jgi:hypothetical protein
MIIGDQRHHDTEVSSLIALEVICSYSQKLSYYVPARRFSCLGFSSLKLLESIFRSVWSEQAESNMRIYRGVESQHTSTLYKKLNVSTINN